MLTSHTKGNAKLLKKQIMKLKALMLAGAVTAAVAGSANAQVFSVNVVGFINLTIPPGFSSIANQLDNGTNTIASLLPAPPGGTKIFKFNGTSFDISEYVVPLGWLPDGNATLLPGQGAFIRNGQSTNLTITVVGNVAVGTNTVQMVPGGFSLISSPIPQSGTLTSMGFPVSDGDKIFRFDNANNSYNIFENISALGGFIPSVPTVNIGESFFVRKANGSTDTNWTRVFTVN